MGTRLSLEMLSSHAFNSLTAQKSRQGPQRVLFEELGNVVIAGVTSNLKMKGIPLSKSEGAIKDSVIKLNYIFTVSEEMISKVVFHLSKEKKRLIFKELCERLSRLEA